MFRRNLVTKLHIFRSVDNSSYSYLFGNGVEASPQVKRAQRFSPGPEGKKQRIGLSNIGRCSSATQAAPGTGKSFPRASPVQGGGHRSITPSESGPGWKVRAPKPLHNIGPPRGTSPGQLEVADAHARERFYADGQRTVAIGIDKRPVSKHAHNPWVR